MDSFTLTFYGLSAALCFFFSLLLLGYAHLQRGTLLVHSGARMLMVFALALFISGNTPVLSDWIVKVLAPALLLFGSVLFYSGVLAYEKNSLPVFDRWGAALVAITLFPFAWWGLIEPNGILRSVVVSLGSVVLCGRIARSLIAITRQRRGGTPTKVLGFIFTVVTIGMLIRGGMLLLADPVPMAQRGNNPTTWVALFWLNVMMAGMTSAILMMDHIRVQQYVAQTQVDIKANHLQKTNRNLQLLWTLVSIIALTILAEVAIGYLLFYQREFQQLSAQAEQGVLLVEGLTIEAHQNTWDSIQPIVWGALLALVVMFSLAWILTGVIRRRDDQEHFIHMLGHELKTPLSVIQMTASAVQLGTAGEGATNNLARIQRAVHEMQNVIERCLQADQIESGLVVPRLSEFNAAAQLTRLCTKPETASRITLQTPDTLICTTDEQLLLVVVSNLIDNALKYSIKDSPIQVSLESCPYKGRAGLRYMVSNQPGSSGFPDPEKVFKKYYRAPKAHGKTGSGLGLHIAERFARMLRGQLSYIPTETRIGFQLQIPITPH